jgi:hypothetical protein
LLATVGFAVAVDFLAGSVTTASVSCTGRAGLAAATGAPAGVVAGAAAGVSAAGAVGVVVMAAAGVGTVFCRVARYPPAAADAIHARASAAIASRFEDIGNSLDCTSGEASAVPDPGCAQVL